MGQGRGRSGYRSGRSSSTASRIQHAYSFSGAVLRSAGPPRDPAAVRGFTEAACSENEESQKPLDQCVIRPAPSSFLSVVLKNDLARWERATNLDRQLACAGSLAGQNTTRFISPVQTSLPRAESGASRIPNTKLTISLIVSESPFSAPLSYTGVARNPANSGANQGSLHAGFSLALKAGGSCRILPTPMTNIGDFVGGCFCQTCWAGMCRNRTAAKAGIWP